MKAQHLAGVEGALQPAWPTLLETPRPRGELARALLADLHEQIVPGTAYTKDQRSQFKTMPT